MRCTSCGELLIVDEYESGICLKCKFPEMFKEEELN
jgi:phage FluMu protein Com